jgi:DNA-binding GntR family transcriptional regulator
MEALDLKPISSRTRRSDVADEIRRLIIFGVLKGGQRITEVALAAQLGVSRQPLREAIRELAETGFLISEPYKSLTVRDFTKRDLTELYSLRAALEQLAFKELWPKRTDDDIRDLRCRLDQLNDSVAQGDSAAGIERELHLHTWCFDVADHRMLADAWSRVRPHLHYYYALHQRAHGRSGPLRHAHDEYVAIACGDDLDAMLSSVAVHMQDGIQNVLPLFGDEE